MQLRQQQLFVGQHHHCAQVGIFGVLFLKRVENVVNLLGLPNVRWNGNEFDLAIGWILRCFKFVARFEFFVFLDKLRCDVVVRCYFGRLVVEIIVAFAAFLAFFEQFLFGGGECVETYEHHAFVVVEVQVGVRFCYIAKNHAIVGNALGTQNLFEFGIKFGQNFPNLGKTLFVILFFGIFVCLFFEKNVPKFLDNLFLFVAHPIEMIFKFFQITNVGENLLGVGHVFIDVVEIGQNHLAKIAETVE